MTQLEQNILNGLRQLLDDRDLDDCPEPPTQSASETYLEYLFRNTINYEANK